MYQFEAVEFVEHVGKADSDENVLGVFYEEADAVKAARVARRAFLASGSKEYAWWVVRVQGARLANFIADSRSDREFMVDLTTGALIEIDPVPAKRNR